jgi:4-hydroxybenzoate polyprenyltransferase
LALGVVYSTDVPFLRWKRFPFMAACCIFLVRAVIVQLGFYLHMRCAVLGLPLQWTQPLLFGTAFMSLCSVVIALFKVHAPRRPAERERERREEKRRVEAHPAGQPGTPTVPNSRPPGGASIAP